MTTTVSDFTVMVTTCFLGLGGLALGIGFREKDRRLGEQVAWAAVLLTWALVLFCLFVELVRVAAKWLAMP